MKLFAGCFGAAILALTFTGCGDDSDSLTAQAPPPAPDGRPAGFEDMMKGMDKNMKKAGDKPRDLPKTTAASEK